MSLEEIKPPNESDLWYYHSHLAAELQGKSAPAEDKRLVEAVSYKLSTSIAGNDRITGAAELRLRALGAERVFPIDLAPTLRVSKVTCDGNEVGFIQSEWEQDGRLYVVLPQAWAKGSEHVLGVEYQGDKVVRKQGGGNFSVGARTSWYPNVNSFRDHASYDLTFKIPKQYTLVSIGKLVKQWK